MLQLKSIYRATAASAIVLLTAANSFANSADSYLDQAVVISANPVYQTVEINSPTEQCWNEKVHVGNNVTRSHTPVILGTIIGAAIGNKFSKGRGRDIATVAGAVLGGSVGRDVNMNKPHHNTRAQTRYERRCETVDRYHTQQQISGYDVSYRYKGNVYNTHTLQHPGNRMTVSVSVVPVIE